MINPTSPLANATIISMSFLVTHPLSASVSHVAERTNRLARFIPLIDVDSNSFEFRICLLLWLGSLWIDVTLPWENWLDHRPAKAKDSVNHPIKKFAVSHI